MHDFKVLHVRIGEHPRTIRRRRAINTWLISGLLGGVLMPVLFLVGLFSVAFDFLPESIHHALMVFTHHCIFPVLHWAFGEQAPGNMKQTILFLFAYGMVVGLIVGLPVAIIAYFIPPRSRETGESV